MLFSVIQYTNRFMNKDGSLLILALHMLNMFSTLFHGNKRMPSTLRMFFDIFR